MPGPSTRSVHLADDVDEHGSIVTPIHTNSAFAHDDVDTWLAVARNERPGHIYTRNSNPTTDAFEARMAALEGAETATSTTTGMGAISSTLFALTEAGSRVVSVKDAYGGTYLMLTEILPTYGVECVVVDTDDTDRLHREIAAGCDVVYLETPTNPALKIIDIAATAEAAHVVGATVVVDNTFATPINTRPIEHGADLVVHSASKYIGGHGDVLGGVVCGASDLVDRIYHFREIAGTGMDPHVAAMFLRSLKTLGLRVARHNDNAMTVARWLADHPRVEAVHHPGLDDHPGHAVAARQMDGFGGMLSFEVAGGLEAVKRILPRLEHAHMAANLGQVETIVGPPATTSHVELTPAERAAAGISEGLVRYSAGIEDVEDLVADLDKALTEA